VEFPAFDGGVEACARDCGVVLKPAEQAPMSIMVLMDMIGDLLLPGVLNVINGFGVEAGKPRAQSKGVAKVASTGETTTGRLISHSPKALGFF
jgi:acyl-CoA reductase-like NAD-dependent aldehyde dehydrogenase